MLSCATLAGMVLEGNGLVAFGDVSAIGTRYAAVVKSGSLENEGTMQFRVVW